MATPIIKWVGGKRQLLDKIKEKLPEKYETYYEPFFGGGAVFFEISPEKAIINDFNIQLINLYKQIQKQPKRVINYLIDYLIFLVAELMKLRWKLHLSNYLLVCSLLQIIQH